jgi:hypothetical protein
MMEAHMMADDRVALGVSEVDVARVIDGAARLNGSLRYVASERSWFLRTRDRWDREGRTYPLHLFGQGKGRTLATSGERAARQHPTFAVATLADLPARRREA